MGRQSETVAFREVTTTAQHAGSDGTNRSEFIEHPGSAKLIVGQPDIAYAETHIRLEAAQLFERAAFHSSDDHDRTSTASNGPLSSFGPADGRLHMSKIYKPNASSSMTPMERFALSSPANDPCPWESRRLMAALELREGSLETVKTRNDAAAVVAASGGRNIPMSVVATAGSVR